MIPGDPYAPNPWEENPWGTDPWASNRWSGATGTETETPAAAGNPVKLLFKTATPRGVATDGEFLFVLNRNTGELFRWFRNDSGRWASDPEPLWTGPPDKKPFVGPTYLAKGNALIVAGFGGDTKPEAGFGLGALYKIEMDGSADVIAEYSTSIDGGQGYLWGPAGTDANDDYIVSSSFWGKVICFLKASGSHKHVVSLDIGDPSAPAWNPDGLALHPDGYLLACDRTNGRLWAFQGDSKKLILEGLTDPIDVCVTASGDAVVVTKGKAPITAGAYRISLSGSTDESLDSLQASSTSLTAIRVAEFTMGKAKACTAYSLDGSEIVVVAVDPEDKSRTGSFDPAIHPDGIYYISR